MQISSLSHSENEVENIADVLRVLKYLSEIIVVDTGSQTIPLK